MMSWACRADGDCVRFWWQGDLLESSHLDDEEGDGRKTLKAILGQLIVRCKVAPDCDNVVAPLGSAGLSHSRSFHTCDFQNRRFLGL